MGLTTIYVSEDNTHVLIDGKRAMYRLHLGSGSVFLDRTQRNVEVSGLVHEASYYSVLEGMDSLTSHLVRTVLVLCRDEEIVAPEFLRQVGKA